MNDIGVNLKRIRLLKDLSLQEAGKLLKMTAPAVSKYESGLIIPNSNKLIDFANAYDVKVTDLLKVHKSPAMKFNSFRKKKKLTGKRLELLKDIIQDKVADYLEVLELSNISSNTIKLKRYSCGNYQDAEIAAEKFRYDYKLSINQPISDLINILENIGIVIIQLDNSNNQFSDFDGLSEIVNGVPVIITLKSKDDGARQRFTISHELGHLILAIDSKELDEEKICNVFAGSLLMPRDSVLKEFGNERSFINNYELFAFKKEYKVSIAATIYRLKELGIISDYLFRNLNMMFRKKDEKYHIIPEESCQFNKLVYKLEANKIITLNKACELMGVSPDEYYEKNYNY